MIITPIVSNISRYIAIIWVLTTNSHTYKMVSALVQTKVLQPEHLAPILLGTDVGRQVIIHTFGFFRQCTAYSCEEASSEESRRSLGGSQLP